MVQVCLISWTRIVLLEPKFHPRTLLVVTTQLLLKLKLKLQRDRSQAMPPAGEAATVTCWVAMVPGPLQEEQK